MVDHRADKEMGPAFSLSETFVRLPGSGWLSGIFNSRRSRPLAGGLRSHLSTHRIAIGVSILWLVIVAAYAAGYLLKVGELGDVAHAMPTLDLLFFAFAISGPISMIMIASMMMDRAARLADAITGQSDTALTLATTIVNLQDSVDALSVSTTERLDRACARMEAGMSASLERTEQALDLTTGKLDTALLYSVIMLDSNLRERFAKSEKALQDHNAGLAQTVAADGRKMLASVETRAEQTLAAHARIIERIDAEQRKCVTRVSDAIHDVSKEQRDSLALVSRTQKKSVERLTAEMLSMVKSNLEDGSRDLRSANVALSMESADAVRAVRSDVIPALATLREELDELRSSVAAHPPASAAELSGLLGSAAVEMVKSEREIVDAMMGRLSAVEENARVLIDRIDRTSRLVAVSEETASTAAPAREEDSADLLFQDLPPLGRQTRLHWTAAVHLLAGYPSTPQIAGAIDAVARDGEIARLVRLRDEILEELGSDGLFGDDLLSAHMPASVWASFARGERHPGIVDLAGVSDDVSLAIARGWMRRNPDNTALALRFLTAFRNLLNRAVSEIGEDDRLVELADTSAGRLFMMLGALTGLFQASE
ncbi:MAG: hypothetical protein AAF334_04835 [Pseudomonadota bacterium]